MIVVRIHRARTKGFVPLAWVIMLFQKMNPFKHSSWNHMALSYVGQTGNWKYADSTMAHGVRDDQTEEEFSHRYKIVHTKTVTISAGQEDFRSWLEEHRRKKYDVWNIVGLMGKILHIFKRNPLGADFRKMVCNELILAFIKRFYGFELGDPDNYDLLMTADLVESL